MNSSGPGYGRWCRGARTGALAIVIALKFATSSQPALADDQGSQAISLSAYVDHLRSLDTVVADCRKQRNTDSCDPSRVGTDLRVQWAFGESKSEREVRFGWLRLLLERAQKKEEPAPAANSGILPVIGPKPDKPLPVTVDALLAQARDRLNEDEKLAVTVAGIPPPKTNRDEERKSLNAILARKEYKTAAQISWKDRLLNKLANWLNDHLSRLFANSSQLPWAALAFRILWIGALCLGLAWFLVRMERQSRVRLSPDPIPPLGAPSARDWQIWLADAQRMSLEGRWREAIHFVYWASISRLESRRLWPPDRARTPREYLLLMQDRDPRKLRLATLTRSFERTWYGGREAFSSDYQAALELAAELGVE
jgi:hypothetical protein